MEWKRGQWIRCNFTALARIDKDDKGNLVPVFEPRHCFYKIMSLSKSRGIFFTSHYTFSSDDGAIMHNGEKASHYGFATALSDEEAECLKKMNVDPNQIMIKSADFKLP